MKSLGFLIQTAYQRTVPVALQTSVPYQRTVPLSNNRGVPYCTNVPYRTAILDDED